MRSFQKHSTIVALCSSIEFSATKIAYFSVSLLTFSKPYGNLFSCDLHAASLFVSFCHVFHFSRCCISTSRHSFSMGWPSPRVSQCFEFCSHWGYYHCHSEFVPALSAFKRSNLEETFLQVIECCHDSFQNGFIYMFQYPLKS